MTFYKKFRTSVAGIALLSAGVVATTAMADQQILDDLIVDGSICAGLDCVNGESFGFDTIRLKENNLRIKFQDTSTSASFPTNDWEITINDSSNGGANYFGVTDVDRGQRPFTIEGGAGANALYVDDGGRIGIGTATPVADLHVKTGNTPTLRLEQDGSSGFSPLIWDLAGNEANFFVRDATNGSDLPFRIFPNAGSNALTIEGGTGDIGMGTTSPDAPLHILDTAGSGGEVMLHLQNNGNPQILFNNTNNGNQWNVGAGTNFVIQHGGGTTPSTLSSTGDLTLTGTITTTGSCNMGCDEVFNENYDLPSMEEQAELMYSNSYLPNVGPTASGPIDVTQKMLGMLNELEKAHIYISQLNAENADLKARFVSENTELKARLADIEKQLQ